MTRHRSLTLAVLIAGGCFLLACGDSQNTDSSGARAGFAPVRGGALVDYTNYTPTPYTPVTPESGAPSAGAGGAADAATEGVAKEAEAFLTGLADALASGQYRKTLDSLNKDARTALSDEKLAAAKVDDTFSKYALARQTIGAKAGEAAVKAVDAAWTNTPLEGRKYTVVNADAVQVSPNPFAALLGPKIAGQSVTLERAGGVWSISLGTVPDDAALAEMGKFHAGLQAAIDKLTDALNALPPEAVAGLAASPILQGMFRAGINAEPLPDLPGGGATGAANSNANGG